MRGHNGIQPAVAEAKNTIHHGLLRFIKDASLAPFLDVAFKLFLRDSRLFGDIDVETLIPRLVEALSSLVIGRITRDKFLLSVNIWSLYLPAC